MIKEEYSPFKIVHHPHVIEKLKEKHSLVPLQVQFVPSNECNQRCSFCAYRIKDSLSNQTFNSHNMLGIEKIIECLDDFKSMGVEAIQYTGGGEPLVHPNIVDIFKHTIQNNLEFSLVTNGMSLDEERCEILGNASWIRVSVDSATPRMYGFMRNVKSEVFDKVIQNIQTLLKYKQSSNKLGVGFVVNRENYLEVFDAAKMFKEIGVDNFRISGAFTPLGYKYFDDFKDVAVDLSRKAEALSDTNFTVFNLFTDRLKDLFEGTQDYDFCPVKELQCYVGADYNVYLCCTQSYNEKGLIGSIKDRSFRDLWESQEKIDLFAKHNPSEMCKHQCIYKNKNEFINYCIKDNPKHINFI